MSRETHVRFCEQPKGKILRLTLLCIMIPPKYSVSSVVGHIKGKSAIAIARQFSGKERNYSGEHFWARGYAVSTVGFELESVKKYIREQESADEQGRF